MATVLFGVANNFDEPSAQPQVLGGDIRRPRRGGVLPDSHPGHRQLPHRGVPTLAVDAVDCANGGSTIGDSLRVAWEDAYQYRGPTPIPDWVSIQPLQHHLEYSLDGTTWAPLWPR